MNERIKELSVQAEEWVSNEFHRLFLENINPDRKVLFDEKFAELIVKECIDLAITEEEKYSFSNSTPAKYFTAAISDFQGVLAKHFGVEE